MWRDVIELGVLEEFESFGEIIERFVYRKVYANKQSVRQSEFYQSASVGLKPELVFEIRSIEFSGAEKVRYQGKEYAIIRTYDKGETVELTVSSFKGSDIHGTQA